MTRDEFMRREYVGALAKLRREQPSLVRRYKRKMLRRLLLIGGTHA